MRKANRVPQLLRDLRRGYGAQKLPEVLRGIDIVGVPTSNMAPTHRKLVKQILPRIKYNNESLRINVEWIANAAKKDASQVPSVSDANETGRAQPSTVLARLHFEGLPTTEFDLRGDTSSTELTRTLLDRITSVTGVKIADPPAATEVDEVAAASEQTVNSTADTIEGAVEEQLQSHNSVVEEHGSEKESLLDSVTASDHTQSEAPSTISKII